MTIIVVGHEKGGVGKSTIANSITRRALDESGLSVVAVDTDSTSSTANWGAIRNHSGIEPHVQVVQIIDATARSILDLNDKYDVVVVDIGARDYSKLKEFGVIADLWIAPVQVGQSDLNSTVRLFEAFQSANHKHFRKHIPMGVLFNRVPTSWNSSEVADAREFLEDNCPGIHVFKTALVDRKAWRDSGRVGYGITEMPGGKAKMEFQRFFDESSKFLQQMAKKGDRK